MVCDPALATASAWPCVRKPVSTPQGMLTSSKPRVDATRDDRKMAWEKLKLKESITQLPCSLRGRGEACHSKVLGSSLIERARLAGGPCLLRSLPVHPGKGQVEQKVGREEHKDKREPAEQQRRTLGLRTPGRLNCDAGSPLTAASARWLTTPSSEACGKDCKHTATAISR